ncbi:MAG: pyruvate, water dikinase regulatory protein [Nitrospirota bacterium]
MTGRQPSPERSETAPGAPFYVFLVSDATGETAAHIAEAALSQFERRDVVFIRRPHVRSEEHIRQVVREARSVHGTILYTLVSSTTRARLVEATRLAGVPSLDLIGPLLAHLESFFGLRPKAEPGLLHRMDEEYVKRIEAVQFTVHHDDGQNVQTLHQSDIVLVGVSRTGKTPLSMYMAQYGWKVANVPIVFGVPPPKDLLAMDPAKVVGLTVSPDKLLTVRAARARKFGHLDMAYATNDGITQELEYCRSLFSANRGWRVLDVTTRAVEEIAADIMSALPSAPRPA